MERGVSRIFFACLIFFITGAHAQHQPVLDGKISIHISNKSIEHCLTQLERNIGYSFSYNSDHFPLDNIVSLQKSDERVKDILTSLLGEDIEVKVIGNTIVLRNPEFTGEIRKYKYDIHGVVYDRFTGEKLKEVSIYQINGKHAALSEQNGQYSITVSGINSFVEIAYSHKNYFDTVIIVEPSKNGRIKVNLTPSDVHPARFRDVQPLPVSQKRTIDSSTLVKIMVPKRQRRFIENIPFLGQPQPVQISFLPNLGTNLDLNAGMENKFSINILAGYSGAVNGIEMGAFLNLVRNDVKGTQFAGFGNLVGGNVEGFQGAGLSNVVRGKVTGGQFAGFMNTATDSVNGVQASGFMNIASDEMNGAQLAGYLNIASKSVKSAGQVSGFANFVFDTIQGVQLAGTFNYARYVKGVQISGLLNIAKTVNGVQFGVVNMADSVHGASIGLFNFVRKGYHPIQVGLNEYAYFAQIKTGTRAFYNVFEAGIALPSQKYWHYAYGFGHSFTLKKEVAYTDLNFTAAVINPAGGFNSAFNILPKLSLCFSYKIIGPLYVFAGPAFNTLLYQNNFIVPFDTKFGRIFQKFNEDINVDSWLGYQFGIRL